MTELHELLPLIDAAELAMEQVVAVRDDPSARLALVRSTYAGPTGRAPHHLRFRRAAISFMRWEVRRGVLNAADAELPGSPWWRALNERLLRDGCEVVARAGGHGGTPSSPTIEAWDGFVSNPTARNWYRAHNGSIAAAYLDHRDLAEAESRVERFFMNVVLLRVLYAHALVAAPRLALGRLALLGRGLGDPRLGMAGIFLSLERVLPLRYPIDGRVEEYVSNENGFGRMLDYTVILPRLQQLYEWSAGELEQPGLAGLIDSGTPTYCWSAGEWQVWEAPTPTPISRALAVATKPRR
jgi:hypothetical protein